MIHNPYIARAVLKFFRCMFLCMTFLMVTHLYTQSCLKYRNLFSSDYVYRLERRGIKGIFFSFLNKWLCNHSLLQRSIVVAAITVHKFIRKESVYSGGSSVSTKPPLCCVQSLFVSGCFQCFGVQAFHFFMFVFCWVMVVGFF